MEFEITPSQNLQSHVFNPFLIMSFKNFVWIWLWYLWLGIEDATIYLILIPHLYDDVGVVIFFSNFIIQLYIWFVWKWIDIYIDFTIVYYWLILYNHVSFFFSNSPICRSMLTFNDCAFLFTLCLQIENMIAKYIWFFSQGIEICCFLYL